MLALLFPVHLLTAFLLLFLAVVNWVQEIYSQAFSVVCVCCFPCQAGRFLFSFSL